MRNSRISFGTLVPPLLVAVLISGCSSEGGTSAVDASSDVTKLECVQVAQNKTQGSVTLINKSEKPVYYFIEVVAESADGATNYDYSAVGIDHVQPGQTATRQLNTSFYDLPPGAVCVLQKVSRRSSTKTGSHIVDGRSDVTKLQCARVTENKTQVVVTVINKSEKPADYFFEVVAESESGGVNYYVTNGWVNHLKPGQTATEDLWPLRHPPGAVCVLRRADRYVAD